MSLMTAMDICKEQGTKVVVTIDEYDRLSRIKHLAKQPDGGPPELSFMRNLFVNLKDNPADFLFVTGVLPLLMTELSGATNDIVVITHQPKLADAVGIPQVVL